MRALTVKRVRFGQDEDNKLRFLKSKTGITPNLLCRIGFCLSLEEPGVPRSEECQDGPREINRYTLCGQLDEVFEALLRQRILEDGLPEDRLDEQFAAHMARGVVLLSARVRALEDLQRR